MKKILALLCLLIPISYSQAQTIVSTTPSNKNALLEEFTGIHCVYCPDGHRIAADIRAANPDRVFLIAIHQGTYAEPGTGEPDYRTAFGDAIANQTGLGGYPAGTINRHVFSGGITALGRSSWNAACNTIMGQAAPVNIAIDVDLNYTTRVITILVEAYYTASSAAPTNYLNVALTQNNIKGPQTGGLAYNPTMITPDGLYLHQHMLRHLLTGQWGTAINTTTAGTFYTTTLNYTIPASINSIPVYLSELEVVAFITQSQQEVLNATGSAVPAPPLDAGITAISDVGSVICSNVFTPTVTLKNFGTNTLTSATINYKTDAGTVSTYNWVGSLASNASTTVTLPVQTMSTNGSHTFYAYTSAPNGGTDLNPLNDQSFKTFIAFLNNITVPVTQDFTSTTFPPANWALVDGGDGLNWVRNGSYGHVAIGSAFINWYNIVGGQTDDLVLNTLDFSNVTDASLSFWFAHKFFNTSLTGDKLQVDVSTDCGANWTTVWMQTGTALCNGTPAYTTSSYTNPVAGDWTQRTISLSAYNNTPTVVLRIRATSGFSNNLFLDDINLTGTISGVPGQPSVISGNTSPCQNTAGLTYSVTQVAGVTYTWTVPSGWSITSGQGTYSITVTAGAAAAAGNITVTPSNASGNGPSRSLAVTPVTNVVPSVSIALTSGTNPMCAGASATFTATPVNGGTTPFYQWKVSGVNAGSNSATFTTSSLANGQQVTCVMTSNAACASPVSATSNGITMTVTASVIPSVSIALTAGTNPMCAGASATFTTTPVNGGTTPSYQWKVNGVNAGTNASTFTTASLTQGQVVSCVMTSNATCASPASATSNGITMTVNPVVVPSVSIAITSGTNPTCTGSAVTFTATVTNGGTTPSYQWKINGVIAGTNASTFTTSALTQGQIVSCVLASNAVCASPVSATSNSITMTVNTTVTPSVSIALTAGTNPMCAGASATFTATPVNGGTTPFFQWKVNGVNAGTNASTFTTAALAQGQVVTCVMTSNAVCASPVSATSNGITMTVNPVVVPSISIAITSGTNPTCSESAVTFTATATNGGTTPSYQWKINGINVGTNASTFTTSALTQGQIVSCILTSNAVCASPTAATSNSIVMTVNPTLTPAVSIALASGTSTICAGTSVTFIASPTNGGATPSYQWKVNGVNAGTNSATFTTSGLTNGQVVSCIMTSNASCLTQPSATSNSITMTVNPIVVPSNIIALTSGTNPTCAGSAVTFTATATNGGTTPSYQWQINGVNAGTNSSTFTSSTLTQGQIVSCILTSNAVCASPATATSNGITMTVNPVVIPSVSIALTAGTNPMCAGTSATFTATPVNGGTTPFYQWRVNGTTVGTNSSTYTTSGLSNGQIVTCILTSNAVCATPVTATSNSITMTVNTVVTPSVSIALTSGSNPQCAGAAATFTATPVNGGLSPSYQWQVNGFNAGTNSPTYTTSGLTDGQFVTCIMTSNALCATPALAGSNSIVMSIIPTVIPSVSIALASGTSTICAGTSVTFNATPINGGTTPSYQWQINGVNAGTNGSTFISSTLTQGQVVTCILTSNAACATPPSATSNGITMTVNPIVIPSVSIALTAGSNPQCAGASATFTATPVNGGTSPFYQWQVNGANIGTNSPTYTTSGLSNGQVVTCLLTSNALCATPVTASSNGITMTVNATLVPSVSIAVTAGSNPTCAGDPITFTATPVNGGTTPFYQWQVNGSNVGSNNINYTSVSLVNGQVVTCIMSSTLACANPIMATSNGITITVNSILIPGVTIALASGTNTICAGTSVTFNATPINGGPAPSYQWKVNGVNTGTNSATFTSSGLTDGQQVTCIMTSNATCASPPSATSNSITMIVNPIVVPSIIIAITSGTNPLCAGTAVTFTATATNGGTTPIYQWQINGVNAGINGNTFTSSTLAQGQTVSCVVTSNAPCASPAMATSNGITMTVNPVVIPSVSIALTAGTNPMCAGTSATFTATPLNGGTAPFYQWQVNGSVVGTNSSTYTTSGLTNGQVVTCILTSNATCANPPSASSNSITMTVNPVVTPSVSIALTSGTNPQCAGASVTFTATPVNGGPSPSYQWQVDGFNAGSNSPAYTTSGLSNGQAVTCILSSDALCTTQANVGSNSIVMTIKPIVIPAVSIALTSGTNPTCAGTAVTFTATPINGGTTPSYQWQINGVNAGTNSSTFTSSSLTQGQIVSCIMTSKAECISTAVANSNGIVMTVNPIAVPDVSIALTSGTNPTCAGIPVTFTAIPVNGGPAPSYQWQTDGFNTGTNSGVFTSSTLSQGQVVTCIMTSSAACASPAFATSNGIAMTIDPIVIPSVSIALTAGGNPQCAGASATFTATPGNGGTLPIYQWQVNGSVVGTNSTTYTTNGLTDGQAVTCLLTSNALCATPATANSNVITMIVNPVVVPTNVITLTSGTNPTCAGAAVTFTAVTTNEGSIPFYQWQINGVNTGTNINTFTSSSLSQGQVITCILTSNAACANPASVTSNGITMVVNPVVVPLVSIALTAGTDPMCSGTSVTFTATSDNGGTSPIYQWQVDGSAVGTNSPQYTTSELTIGKIVTCILISVAPCATPAVVSSNSITVTVNPIVIPTITIAITEGTNPSCEGSSMTFTATTSNGGSHPFYQWQVNGLNTGTNSSTFTTTSLTNKQTVTCILTSDEACATPTTAVATGIMVTINALPAAPVITQNINDLTSSYPTGNQWYNASGIMTGETGQILSVTADGDYYVVYTDTNGCISPPSNTLNVLYTGIDEALLQQAVIAPNPTTGMVRIILASVMSDIVNVEVYNPHGKIIRNYRFSGEPEFSIDLRDCADGMYFIRLYSVHESILHRIILQK